jgi:hypothetical protein
MGIATLSLFILNHFEWHPARAKTFIQAALSLIMGGSVTLKHVAQGFQQGDAKVGSVCRQLQRFLKEQAIDFEAFGIIIQNFMELHTKVYVALDRTNWDFGVFHINFLFITVIYGKVSIPIVWMLLDKEGNSDTQERIDLVNQFLKIIPAKQIIAILGDREFIGKEWFLFLENMKIPYVMRVKSNTNMRHQNGGYVNAKLLFAHLEINSFIQIRTKVWEKERQVACIVHDIFYPKCDKKEIVMANRRRF